MSPHSVAGKQIAHCKRALIMMLPWARFPARMMCSPDVWMHRIAFVYVALCWCYVIPNTSYQTLGYLGATSGLAGAVVLCMAHGAGAEGGQQLGYIAMDPLTKIRPFRNLSSLFGLAGINA